MALSEEALASEYYEGIGELILNSNILSVHKSIYRHVYL